MVNGDMDSPATKGDVIRVREQVRKLRKELYDNYPTKIGKIAEEEAKGVVELQRARCKNKRKEEREEWLSKNTDFNKYNSRLQKVRDNWEYPTFTSLLLGIAYLVLKIIEKVV